MSFIALSVGYFVIVAIALFFISFAAAIAVDAWERVRDREEKEAVEIAALRLGSHLKTYSWWFSEDPATMQLLQSIGESIEASGECSFDVTELRKEWRHFREKDQEFIRQWNQ